MARAPGSRACAGTFLAASSGWPGVGPLPRRLLSSSRTTERIRRERARVGIEGMPEPLRDAFLACLHRLRPPPFEELKELVMLTMEMLSDGTLIASPQGRRLFRKFTKQKVKEGRVEGRVEGKRDALRASLTRRFGELAPEALAVLEATVDEALLDAAHEAFADGLPLARTLERLQVPPSE